MTGKNTTKSNLADREKRLNIKFRIFQGWSRMGNCAVYLLQEYKSYFWGLFHGWESVSEGWSFLSEEKAHAAMCVLIKERKQKSELPEFKIERKVLNEYTEAGELVQEQTLSVWLVPRH